MRSDAPSSLHLDVTTGPRTPAILLTSSETVAPLFRDRLANELSDGQVGIAGQIRISIEAFLRYRGVIRMLCSQYGVAVTASDEVRTILSSAEGQTVELQATLSDPKVLTPAEVDARLAGTRFSRPLKDFQYRDVGHLLAMPNGANFSVPGAGKTVVALAVYEAERAAERVHRLLVIAPLSAFGAWQTELVDCFSQSPGMHIFDVGCPIPLSAEVLIANYEKLPNHLDRIAQWARASATLVILDEAHRIKRGRTGAHGAASLDLAWFGERRDILTGTPAPQHPMDLEAQLDFLWPSQARSILPREAFDRVPLPSTGRHVARAIQNLFVRTRKSELGLREPIVAVLGLELQGIHREIYQALQGAYAGMVPILRKDRANFARMRRVVMYLLEAATNPALLPVGSSPDDPPVFEHPPVPLAGDEDLGRLLREYGQYETPAKFRKVGELVMNNSDQGRKTLIWSNFVRNLETLKRELNRYAPAMVHGGVCSEFSNPGVSPSREAEVERFRHDPDCMVLVANPAAMSEGISLHHTCHDAIYLERTFNAGQFLQSVDRIHRLGLSADQETRVTFLVTKDTIDEIVLRRVREKAERLSAMLDDPDIVTMGLPTEDDLVDVDEGLGRPIDSDADVTALFEHLSGASIDD